MQRRHFLATAGLAALGASTAPAWAAAAPSKRDYYELRQYLLETDAQRTLFDGYMKDAFIPACNRAGVQPVGVFFPEKADPKLASAYVLMRHTSAESIFTLTQKLIQDQEHLQKGADFWNAPASAPAYKRMETWLFLAFAGMPQIETPAKGPERVFQLRIYESPSVKTGQKKIEMFNDAGEIKIFREVGLNPVFFGEAIAGAKMPNLTYMLGFEKAADMAEAWKRFGPHPEWQKLRKMPEYADKEILCGITNIVLKPAPYSQI
ncbi:MAG: NIPSNAP family protein [Verrucomicrobiae bacterium]|nr:NIPSNAP family protein [Verrucomicrobiae bacterium]